jgi:hypothetical protein
VAAAAVQLSALKHWPIIQASEENTLNAAEEAYCQLPEVRDEKYFATLPNGEFLFVLTAEKNKWPCKRTVRQHNRDFALAAFWVVGPRALALLVVWFLPFSRRRP